MKKVKIVGTAIAIILFLGGLVLLTGLLSNQDPLPSKSSALPSAAPTPDAQEVNVRASFQITTRGIVRSFKNPKYHLKSEEVYISPDDPTVVQVKRIGVTWEDFFKTLPMKLTKYCLTTGDGETFCTGSGGTLKFYLNGEEDPDLLDREIKDGDKALIRY